MCTTENKDDKFWLVSGTNFWSEERYFICVCIRKFSPHLLSLNCILLTSPNSSTTTTFFAKKKYQKHYATISWMCWVSTNVAGRSVKDELTNSVVKFQQLRYGMVDYVSTTIGRNTYCIHHRPLLHVSMVDYWLAAIIRHPPLVILG
jgi:hypothetical protein